MKPEQLSALKRFMDKPELTRKRVVIAYVIAVVADLLELPITAAQFSIVGLAAGESAAFVVDSIVFVVMTKLLGFHWMFLPSFCIGLIPGLDMLPTWVGCVFFAVRQRKKEQDKGKNEQNLTIELK
jgi:hypothetical protein